MWVIVAEGAMGEGDVGVGLAIVACDLGPWWVRFACMAVLVDSFMESSGWE